MVLAGNNFKWRWQEGVGLHLSGPVWFLEHHDTLVRIEPASKHWKPRVYCVLLCLLHCVSAYMLSNVLSLLVSFQFAYVFASCRAFKKKTTDATSLYGNIAAQFSLAVVHQKPKKTKKATAILFHFVFPKKIMVAWYLRGISQTPHIYL